MGWATLWAIFPKSHLVTLVSIYLGPGLSLFFWSIFLLTFFYILQPFRQMERSLNLYLTISQTQ
jgi:hypothetical protein